MLYAHFYYIFSGGAAFCTFLPNIPCHPDATVCFQNKISATVKLRGFQTDNFRERESPCRITYAWIWTWLLRNGCGYFMLPSGKPTFWRCISYWTWGFSNVMLVFRGVFPILGFKRRCMSFTSNETLAWATPRAVAAAQNDLQHRHLRWDVHIKCSITPAKLIQGNKWPNNPRQAVGYTFQGRDCDRCRSSSEENEVQSHPFTFQGVSERCGFCFPHAIAWLEHVSWHDFSYRVFDMLMCQIFFIELWAEDFWLNNWGSLVSSSWTFHHQHAWRIYILIFCNSPANAPIW